MPNDLNGFLLAAKCDKLTVNCHNIRLIINVTLTRAINQRVDVQLANVDSNMNRDCRNSLLSQREGPFNGYNDVGSLDFVFSDTPSMNVSVHIFCH